MIKLFTHTDLDGVGCAILAKLAFEDDVDIEYCGYDDIDDKVDEFVRSSAIEKFNNVYITDISIKDNRLIKTIDMLYPDKIRLFDHHKTAEYLNEYSWAYVSEFDGELGFKTCGTELFYKHLMEFEYLKDTERYRTFVWAVTAYDTWNWKSMKPEEGKIIKELNDLLYILGRDEFVARCIRRRKVKGDDSMIVASKDERLILDKRQKEIDDYIKSKDYQMHIVRTINMNVGVVFADRFISELGNNLCEKYINDIDCIAIIDIGLGKVSYRSVKDDMDVGKLAKSLGGGGHKSASGFIVDESIRERNITDIFYSLHASGYIYRPHVKEEATEEPKKKSWFGRSKKKK